MLLLVLFFFFFNDPATTEIYTFPYTTLFRSPAPAQSRDQPVLGQRIQRPAGIRARRGLRLHHQPLPGAADRKSTRLNSSHTVISYAVFCLKKKKKNNKSN